MTITAIYRVGYPAAGSTIYRVGYLSPVPPRTPYPAIVGYVGQMLGRLPRDTELVIDFTGVGRPVFDMFVHSGFRLAA